MESATLLERTQLSVNKPRYTKEDTLPREVFDALGYIPLLRKAQRSTMSQLLAQMGIMPFTKASVDEYKQAKLESVNRTVRWYHYLLPVIHWWALVGCITAFGPAVLGWIISWKISVAFMLIFPTLVTVFIVLENKKVKLKGKWSLIPLKECKIPIPEFVLQDALTIHQEFPEATFFVDQFVQNEIVLDPFLEVQYGTQSYLVHVWNEPDFKSEREV